MLIENDQGHVVAFWSELGANDDAKRRLVQQLARLDAAYPGGLKAYLDRARTLLEAARRGDNPFDGMRPSVPTGVTLSVMSGTGRMEAFERRGLDAARHTAFVLVAGGLGERLGYNGIKVPRPPRAPCAPRTPVPLAAPVARASRLSPGTEQGGPCRSALTASGDVNRNVLPGAVHQDHLDVASAKPGGAASAARDHDER